MFKILTVGDPHAKVGNLKEMKNLINFIYEMASKYTVDRIEILGDLFHSHAVVRLEVQEFWSWALTHLASIKETVVLVGNHDLSGDYGSSYSALSAFVSGKYSNLVIVEKPTLLKPGLMGYVPYIHNHDAFIAAATQLANAGANVLVCHQTIQGSRYESGMYTPDGVPTGEWSKRFKCIRSGHLHAEQNFGNIIYPGTARWDTTADANQRKGIWIYEHDDFGTIVKSDFFSTEKICTPILELTYSEGEKEPVIPDNAKVSLVLKGTSDWVKKEKEKFVGKVHLKTNYTDTKKTMIRKTGGSFEEFLKNHFPSTMDKEHLLKLAKELNLV